ncbi:MAG: penicillin-binding protein [Ruminococcaceae bacterium]|nr:penicillin-binding protein [Oscillospiraceae bacterium]
MKQVRQRTILVALLVLLLLLGISVFCVKYAVNGSRWADFSANEHTFTDGRLTSGQILDRNGLLLYDAASGQYAESELIRQATLHAVGDPDNNISTSAKAALRAHLIGYHIVTGTTSAGNRLYLTLDAELNRTAYEALHGRKGTVAVYNYKTGEILCMVSSPTFDPADPPEIRDSDGRYEGVYLNRFLSSVFVPGSVFKVVTTAAALENIPDIMSRRFTCTGSTEIGGDIVTCPHVHGEMDFYGALANSCNCAYAQLAVELGGDTLQRYADSAGLLDVHSVSGIATAAGSFEAGSDSQLGWAGVGQYNDMVNPCAMLTLMGAIASDGQAAQPRLIARETSMSGLSLGWAERTQTFTAWSVATRQTLRDMMRNSVTTVYGQDRFGDLAVCAKSGTAEVGAGQTPHAWFAGFLEDTEHPLAFVVLVENGGSGSETAGNVAAAVLRQAVEKEVQP